MPSPQPQSSQPRYSTRRSSSLPPEKVRLKRSSPVPLIKQIRVSIPDDSKSDNGAVEIEELSPEAIIPDSVTVLRDPEIEVPEEEDTNELDLEQRFTEIKLDRMTDGSESERAQSEEALDPGEEERESRKRKLTPSSADESDRVTPRRKTKRTIYATRAAVTDTED